MKVDNLTILHKETDKYKGTLVLSHFKVVLFHEIVVTTDDYYYKVQEYNQSKPYYASCVGLIIPLKGRIKKNHYKYLLAWWNNSKNTTIAK